MSAASLSFDHAVLVVKDLNAGISQFKDLGFTISPGGVHAGGQTHNALIGLADNTYLELVAATRRSISALLRFIRLAGAWRFYLPTRTSMGRRFLGLVAAGPGVGDFALRTQDLELTINSIRNRGLIMGDPVSGSRMRPDGQVVAWRTSVPQTNDLPFLIEDITPRDLRLPAETSRNHKNEALGITKITVMVAELDRSTARYQAMLGTEPSLPLQTGSYGLQPVLFQVGESTTIELAALPATDAGGRRHLASRQGRPLQISLTTRSGEILSLEHTPQTGNGLSTFS
jgi:hypothetical protein